MRSIDEARDRASGLAAAWWLFLIVGAVSLAAGVILIAKPSNSLAVLAIVFGIFLLVDGIAELVMSFGSHTENRAMAAILGVLGIVVGIVLIRHPFHGVTAIGLLIGIWLVAAGVVRFVRSLAISSRPAVWLRLKCGPPITSGLPSAVTLSGTSAGRSPR